jgi:alpha-1,6-mannosyltransferase
VPLRRAAVARLLDRLQPDLIEAGDPYRLAWSVLDAAERRGVPALAFCHSNPMALATRSVELLGLGRVGAAAERACAAYLSRLYRRFDLVLAPSEWMNRQLRELGVPNACQQALGVEGAVFHPGRRDFRWRRSAGLPQQSRVLVYVGRFALEKRLQALADAVDRLGPPYLLLAVGTGPMPPRGDRVRVVPWQHDKSLLARLLASADGFVHAGDQETFGLSALEAMACGTPVALRKAAGLAELVEGGCGVGVESDSPQAWAAGIEAMFDSAREQRVRKARQRAEEHDWTRVLPELERKYRSVMQVRRQGAGEALAV